MARFLAVANAVAILFWPVGLSGHEGHVHRVMGTVVMIDGTHIEIDTTEGKRESHTLTERTKYLRGKTPATPGDVKIGARVVLSLVEKSGRQSVTEVRLGEGRTEHERRP